MIRSDRFPTCSGVITSELMSPAAWDHAVAKAERAGGPLHGELVRLAQRFDEIRYKRKKPARAV